MKVSNWSGSLARKLGAAVKRTAAPAIMAGGIMFAGAASAAEIQLDFEDFEGLALQDTVNGIDGNGVSDGGLDSEVSASAVWTDVPPTGWTRDNTTTPVGGPIEFFGWTFVDKDWHDTTAGQGRGSFSRASGTYAVADGDEYDDDWAGIGSDNFNAFLTTPTYDLTSTGLPQVKAIEVNFDSGLFPYDNQTALVDVSFDGGLTWENALTLNSANIPGGDSSADRFDVAESLRVSAVGKGTDLQVRFGYVDADNDWWWAVDNVEVVASSVPEPGSVALGGLAIAGAAAALRRRK